MDKSCTDLDAILTDIEHLSQVTRCRNFKFIVREANTAAHVIAKLVVKFSRNCTCANGIPSVLASAVLADVPSRCIFGVCLMKFPSLKKAQI